MYRKVYKGHVKLLSFCQLITVLKIDRSLGHEEGKCCHAQPHAYQKSDDVIRETLLRSFMPPILSWLTLVLLL